MRSVLFTIQGKPTAWQRAGLSTKQGRALIYTKAESRSYQSLVRDAAKAEWHGGPSESPFFLSVTVHTKRPKGHYRRGAIKADAPDRCCRRPDVDNVAKQIGDALNGVVWHDDAQVCTLSVVRVWAESDHVVVAIEEMPVTHES